MPRRVGRWTTWLLEYWLRNFAPGFFVEHFVKDMGLALEEAKRMGLVLPGLSLVHQLYLAVQAHGHGRSGTHALMVALEELSNVHVSAVPDEPSQ